MKEKFRSFATVAVVLCILPLKCASQDASPTVIKQQERNSVSIALEFTKKSRNSVQRALSLVGGIDPNAYATGFLVGNGLVLTSYHVVSGKLSAAKKKTIGFKLNDELEVKAYVNNCLAKVVKIDEEADLALLRICDTSKQAKRPTFRTDPVKDEQLFVVAQPVKHRMIRRGSFHGLYTYQGQLYWSAKIDGQDGFSGSPVYDDKGGVVGVFCSYDSIQEVALICPGVKAQKFLADYDAGLQPK
jgi:trypsin-like peptidase